MVAAVRTATAAAHRADTASGPVRGAGRPGGGLGPIAPAAFVLMFSSAFIAGVIGVGSAPPLLLISARFAGAALLMGAYALAVRAPWPRGRLLGHVVVSGLLIQAVQFGSFYLALGWHLPTAIIALVQGLNPVVVALLATRVLGEKVGRRQWAGFAIGGLGVLLALSAVMHASALALVLCGVGLLGISTGTVYQKRFAAHMDIRTGTAVQFGVSAPVVFAVSLAISAPRVHAWTPFALSLAWMIVVNSVGAFGLLYWMLHRSSANRVSMLFFLTPSVTAMMSWLIVGQSLRPAEIAGLAVAGAGMLLATARGSSAAPDACRRDRSTWRSRLRPAASRLLRTGR